MTPAVSDDPDLVPGLDPVASQRWQALPRTDSPWLHEEVGSRMAERLQWFREQPSSWLHWEPVAGGLQVHRRLRERLPDAACHVWSHDMAAAQAATRDPAARGWNPFRRAKAAVPAGADTRVQMLWANMGLHLEARPQALIRRWHAQVQTGGFLMFSCLGPDSLRELRAVHARMGWPAPAHDFTDMHDWGDMLVHAGFAEPVMDMERITLTYGSADALLAELRGLGRNLSVQRFAACRSRGWRTQLAQAIEAHHARGPDGRLQLTFEVIYGHAFKAPPRAAVSPTSTVPLDDLRDMLRQRRA